MPFTTTATHRMSKIENRLPKQRPKAKKYDTKPKDHNKIAKLNTKRSDRVYTIG